MKKVLGAFPRFLRPETKLFAVKFRCILEVVALKGLWKKFWVHYLDFFVQKQSCFHEVQMHFESSLPARFREKILGEIPRFMCSKMKLPAVKFRRILEVFALHAL